MWFGPLFLDMRTLDLGLGVLGSRCVSATSMLVIIRVTFI